MMVLDNKYNIGDTVFLLTDPEQYPRMVTAIIIRYKGYIEYEVSFSSTSNNFTEIELCDEKALVI